MYDQVGLRDHLLDVLDRFPDVSEQDLYGMINHEMKHWLHQVRAQQASALTGMFSNSFLQVPGGFTDRGFGGY